MTTNEPPFDDQDTRDDHDRKLLQGPTVTPDTEQPHVHTTDEAPLWWREAFPQWRGRQ